MLNNVPHIVDSALVFREKLIENVGKGMVLLDELTTKLAMEVILKVTLYVFSGQTRIWLCSQLYQGMMIQTTNDLLTSFRLRLAVSFAGIPFGTLVCYCTPSVPLFRGTMDICNEHVYS